MKTKPKPNAKPKRRPLSDYMCRDEEQYRPAWMTDAHQRTRALQARCFSEAMEHHFHLKFSPGGWLNDDRSSQGHIIQGFFNFGDDQESLITITLDDRKPNLALQLVRELERLENFYQALRVRVQNALSVYPDRPENMGGEGGGA